MKHFDEHGYVSSEEFEKLLEQVAELVVEALEGCSSIECMVAAKHLSTEVSFRCGAVGLESFIKETVK